MTLKTGNLQGLQTLLLGLISTATVGLFVFVINVNSTLAVMKEQMMNKTENINKVQQDVNDIRLTVNAVQLQVQRVEDHYNK